MLEIVLCHILQREQAPNGSRSGANYSCGGETNSDNGECKVNEKISCLIGSQTRSNFYKVEGGLMALLRCCLESEVGNSYSILSGYVDHFQCLESVDAGSVSYTHLTLPTTPYV